MFASRSRSSTVAGAIMLVAGVVAYVLMVSAPRNPARAADDEHKHGAAPAARSEHWAPVENAHLYLCAFHMSKKDPSFQVEAHHFCSPAGKDIHQCMVFDSKGPNAKLLGVEYIVSDAVYQSLPTEERKYWHPHAYEILSGQLIAPDLPKLGDDAFPGFIKSWGKTWHTWPDPTTAVPMGEPILMWSAGGDGQIKEDLVAKRDAQFNIKTSEIRDRRKAMGFAVPNVAPPKSLDEPGHQFTATGADEPRKLTQ